VTRALTVAYDRPMPPEKPQWAELFGEVVTSGLCTGCAGCIVACPYDVLRYDETSWRPFHVDEDGGPADCTHGQRGCTLCTRACPRFRRWEPEVDQFLFGRPREPAEVFGVASALWLGRATDPELAEAGQDGGAVSALLVWALEHDVIDAALVSYVDPAAPQKTRPGVARTRADVLAAAGSRYGYSANPLAYRDAVEAGAERLALVGMSCQASLPAVMAARRAGKVARRLALSIGLLCSKTFDDAIYRELFQDRYHIPVDRLAKVNIKGRFQVWTTDGEYFEVPLKEGHDWTRAGCLACPDFAAEHADVSAGGIGAEPGWTLLVVRSARGAEALAGAVDDGAIETRPASEDPEALRLLRRLSRVSRTRWPAGADPAPAVLPPKTSAPPAPA